MPWMPTARATAAKSGFSRIRSVVHDPVSLHLQLDEAQPRCFLVEHHVHSNRENAQPGGAQSSPISIAQTAVGPENATDLPIRERRLNTRWPAANSVGHRAVRERSIRANGLVPFIAEISVPPNKGRRTDIGHEYGVSPLVDPARRAAADGFCG
jgi:hypothetical protein